MSKLKKYIYKVYDYYNIINPRKISPFVVQKMELRDNMLYITYNGGIDYIDATINLNELVGTANE